MKEILLSFDMYNKVHTGSLPCHPPIQQPACLHSNGERVGLLSFNYSLRVKFPSHALKSNGRVHYDSIAL
jgi:hypothetical protein